MNLTVLMMVVLLGNNAAELKTCKVCHKQYSTSRLSRASMVRIASETASRHGVRGSRSRSAMVEIAHKESTFRPTTRNKRSTAYGLYGFLNSTWKGTGVKKTDCPNCQTEAAMRYIKARYGTPEKALAFHRKHGWY